MTKIYIYLCIAALASIVTCSTTNSETMYDPKESVVPIDITIFGKIDPSNRTIALPPGGDDLLLALKNAFSNDGWWSYPVSVDRSGLASWVTPKCFDSYSIGEL